jgi:flavin-dependent dehydrogenase
VSADFSPVVVVIGAGIAGCAAALTLARTGAEVRLLDSPRRGGAPIGETLPGSARPLLRQLGVWDPFCAAGFAPACGHVAVWGGAEPLVSDAILDPHGHGWQVDRERFAALLKRAVMTAGVRAMAATVIAAERRGGAWKLGLETAAGFATMAADFAVDATGRSGSFARLAGGERRHLDRLVCRHARCRAGDGDRDGRTWIEAVPGGWWYTSRLADGERVFAFLTDADLLQADADATADFVRRLRATQAIRRFLPDVAPVICRAPAVTVARTSRLLTCGGPGWLAVGDSALAFDPLAGRGMLNALRTGIAGAEAILGEPNRFAAALERTWTAYLRARTAGYAGETRWPEEPFWARRSLDALVPAAV